jgi:hypothetical protein
VKAPTTAMATKAAATAYSDNSSPVSSNKNLFTFVPSTGKFRSQQNVSLDIENGWRALLKSFN